MNKLYTIDEIENLITEYKKGNKDKTTQQIYEAFEGFIYKYAYFIKYGRIKDNDKQLILLSSIISIEKVMKMLNTWELQDVFNELYIIFIKSIDKFVKQKNGVNFVGYINSCFKYNIKEWLRQLSKDILYNSCLISIEEIYNLKEEEKPQPIEYENLCINNKLPLSSEEKYILFLYCSKELSLTEIAKRLSMSRIYITKVKNKAIKKVLNCNIEKDDMLKN